MVYQWLLDGHYHGMTMLYWSGAAAYYMASGLCFRPGHSDHAPLTLSLPIHHLLSQSISTTNSIQATSHFSYSAIL